MGLTINVSSTEACVRLYSYSDPISFPSQDEKTVPVAISVLRARLQVKVVSDGDLHGISSKTANIIATVASTSTAVIFSGVSQTLPELIGNESAVIFEVDVDSHNPEVPWGFSDHMSFQLQIEGGQAFEIEDKALLTIYALADDLPDYVDTEGLPIQFLEMMTLESDPKLQAHWADAQHSYRYNAFVGGASNYVFDDGAVFDLDQWLVNCKPSKQGQWYGVNCYDMSALLQTALRLGLPYYYVNEDNESVDGVLTVLKAFRQPYGYIKTLDLIGWGDSNSPFFDDSTKKLLGPQKDSLRQSFWNHAWVYVRMSSTNQNDLPTVDACAGPTAIPTPVEKYLENAVDVNRTLASTEKFSDFNPDKVPTEYTGVISITVDQPRTFWQQTTFAGESTLRLRYGKQLLYIKGNGKPNEELVTVESVIQKQPKPIDPIPVHVNDLLITGFTALATSLNLPAPQTGTELPLVQSKTFTCGSFTIRTPELSVTKNGSILRFDLWTAESGPPLMTINVVVLTDFKTALEYLVGHFSMLSHGSASVWHITKDAIANGKIDISPTEDAPVGAVIRSNVLVTIDGTNNTDAMNAVLGDMGNFMDAYFGKPIVKVDTPGVDQHGVFSQASAVDETLSPYFFVPGAVDFSLASNTKIVIVNEDPWFEAESGFWNTSLTLVKPPNGQDASDTLVGAFAAKDTFYVTSKEFPIFL